MSTQPAPFSLTVSPRWAFYGQAIWVRCFVPLHEQAAYITIGIEDVRLSTSPGLIQQHEILIERLPCGPLTAVCVIEPNRKRRTQEIEVKGGPCEGGA